MGMCIQRGDNLKNIYLPYFQYVLYLGSLKDGNVHAIYTLNY